MRPARSGGNAPDRTPLNYRGDRALGRMHALIAVLVPVIVVVVVGLIIWWVAERFSPDPLVTKIVQVVVFAAVLIVLLMKLMPLLGA